MRGIAWCAAQATKATTGYPSPNVRKWLDAWLRPQVSKTTPKCVVTTVVRMNGAAKFCATLVLRRVDLPAASGPVSTTIHGSVLLWKEQE